MSELSGNRCVIDGELLEQGELRYTPAGVARLEMKLKHVSTQFEAGAERQVQCEITVLALGDAAMQASKVKAGQQLSVDGFLAQRSLRNTQLVLHVNNIKLK